MNNIGKYRFLKNGQFYYFSLTDFTLQTKVYRHFLAGKKAIPKMDQFTGFIDITGKEIYTRDILECEFINEEHKEDSFTEQYIVKHGNCKETMYGTKFRGFYLQEISTGDIFSFWDEIQTKRHSEFKVIGQNLEVVKKKQKKTIIFADEFKAYVKTRWQIKKLKWLRIKKWLNYNYKKIRDFLKKMIKKIQYFMKYIFKWSRIRVKLFLRIFKKF